MPKVEIKSPTGLHIIVEGTVDEVSTIVNQAKELTQNLPKKFDVSIKHRSSKTKDSLKVFILSLRDEGFFDIPQGIGLVKTKLEQNAHSYSLPSISTTLIRLVRKGELGRVKETGEWLYVKR